MTGDAAVKGIREIDSSGTIAFVGGEPHRPYKRPALTKDLWKGKPVEESLAQDAGGRSRISSRADHLIA